MDLTCFTVEPSFLTPSVACCAMLETILLNGKLTKHFLALKEASRFMMYIGESRLNFDDHVHVHIYFEDSLDDFKDRCLTPWSIM